MIPDPAAMLIFVLLVSTLMLVVEREAQPYLKQETSMSVYVLQWQVILFIQGLLLVDADLTNTKGALFIGLALLLLNLCMIVVIAVGAHETMARESIRRRSIERKPRRFSSTGMLRMISGLPGQSRATKPPAEVAEIELSQVDAYPDAESQIEDIMFQTPSRSPRAMEATQLGPEAVMFDNPITVARARKAKVETAVAAEEAADTDGAGQNPVHVQPSKKTIMFDNPITVARAKNANPVVVDVEHEEDGMGDLGVVDVEEGGDSDSSDEEVVVTSGGPGHASNHISTANTGLGPRSVPNRMQYLKSFNKAPQIRTNRSFVESPRSHDAHDDDKL